MKRPSDGIIRPEKVKMAKGKAKAGYYDQDEVIDQAVIVLLEEIEKEKKEAA